MNHSLLSAFGVGHPRLDQIVSLTQTFGLHSKLTGAGGGGCALTLLPAKTTPATVEQVVKSLESAGFTCYEASVGCPGVELLQVKDRLELIIKALEMGDMCEVPFLSE